MRKLLLALILCTSFLSCKTDYKKCDSQFYDDHLKAYNDILNEIIIHRSYNRYLGKDEEQIFEKYASNIADSDKIDKEVISIHNKIFNDTSQFCTIYLDTVLKRNFNPWSYYLTDTNSFSMKIKSLLGTFSENGQSILDSMNLIQQRYSAMDYRLCIAKISSLKDRPSDNSRCYIGKIVFSKLVTNKSKDKGLLYYEFRCGGLCGYGDLIYIEKENNHWHIQNSIQLWIS